MDSRAGVKKDATCELQQNLKTRVRIPHAILDVETPSSLPAERELPATDVRRRVVVLHGPELDVRRLLLVLEHTLSRLVEAVDHQLEVFLVPKARSREVA